MCLIVPIEFGESSEYIISVNTNSANLKFLFFPLCPFIIDFFYFLKFKMIVIDVVI